jgi:chromosome segregation ATPase
MEVGAMTESLRELAAKSLSELAVKHERKLQEIAEAEDRLADLQAKKAVTVAQLEKATAELKEARQEHRDVEASLVSLEKRWNEIRRQADAAWKEMQAIKANAAWKEMQALRVS